MCGIWAVIENDCQVDNTKLIKQVQRLLEHRGPDQCSYKIIKDSGKQITLVHTRLRIVGDNTPQPLSNSEDTIHLIVNGEIFNWKELSKELDYKCIKSDCEILIPLYEEYVVKQNNINKFFEKINGQFSFILYDTNLHKLFVGRDQIGVTPLYYGYTKLNEIDEKIIYTSELKCLSIMNEDLLSLTENIFHFEPRHYIYKQITDSYKTTNRNGSLELHRDPYMTYSKYNNNMEYESTEMVLKLLKNKLEDAVYLQIEDVLGKEDNENFDFGVLLSGGLDSSLIASITNKKFKQVGKKIKTFSIGMNPQASDLIAAREVAKFLDTDHHEFYFTVDEGLKNINNVIWYIESYDCTSVRASTAMYMLTKKIKKKYPNIKVLFSGELSDELLCYLYGANAPTYDDYQNETIKLVNNVYLFDCLRANKTCMANSIEVRVPFTDPEYVKFILSLHPKYKVFGKLNNILGDKVMEKQILRDAFVGYLPENILYRKKEQFSDGVSSFGKNEMSWIDYLKQYTELLYSDELFLRQSNSYKYNRPDTKEKMYYREIFTAMFNPFNNNTSEETVKYWEPNWSKTNDPSAREYAGDQF